MSSEASERWLAISERFPIGPKRRSGLLRTTEPTNEVVPGQVRQAYWQEVSVVVIIDSIDDTTAQALVFPATLEPGVEDHSAIIIEENSSPLHGPIAIWPDLPAFVPLAVLGATIASLPGPTLRAIKQATSTGTPAVGLRRGHGDPALGSGAALALDELFDGIDALQRAPHLLPAADAAPPAQLQVPLPAIMSALNVPQPRAMAIRLGKEPLTVEDACLLAAAADVQVEQVLAAIAPLPDDLRRELQEPRWRAHIRERATDGDEDRARTRLGYEAYQLAARETGAGRELWRQRLHAVLATESQ